MTNVARGERGGVMILGKLPMFICEGRLEGTKKIRWLLFWALQDFKYSVGWGKKTCGETPAPCFSCCRLTNFLITNISRPRAQSNIPDKQKTNTASTPFNPQSPYPPQWASYPVPYPTAAAHTQTASYSSIQSHLHPPSAYPPEFPLPG